MAEGRDSKEQSEFCEYCWRWLAENRRGPRGSWATAAVLRAPVSRAWVAARHRTDNGTPFASAAPARLSRLSVWWIKLGIHPELIEWASPQQNGTHERMHRTLKAEATRPPAGSVAAQKRCFNRFQTVFNREVGNGQT
jgi:transposase InsO family protein